MKEICLCILWFCTIYFAVGQQSDVQRKYIDLTAQHSYAGENLNDGRIYHSTLITLQQAFNLSRHSKQFPFIFKLETHFGITNISTGGNRDWELAGVSGLETHLTLNNGIRFNFSALSGPAFISAKTRKQRRGFLFSNSLEGSILIPFGRNGYFIKPEFRFRHMSNAGLWDPNVGLDNWFIGIGIGYQHLRRSQSDSNR